MGKNDWHWDRAKSTGPADRAVRFDKAAKAMAQSQKRNRDILDGGSGCPILVEGKKDEIALRALGFSGIIEKINRGWDRSRLVAYFHDKYGTQNVVDGGPPLILLMDWDRTGGRLQTALRDRLQSMDVKVDEELRMILLKTMKPEGRTVEALTPYANSLLPLIRSYSEEE
ncbi:MAG TPA: hypothetical protein QF508_03390 [Candidatus Thalassarchaeaceae archaeon]|nr:hypothetical protein [Candidatus Thalassarchaeaceae archaeon]|tara:strand:+ start:1817 stop:2326 length:510 start_codon:yes stop_codon:yes gene_type:complete